MPNIKIDAPAPDFTLTDFRRQEVKLSQFIANKNVVLVFNRGFS